MRESISKEWKQIIVDFTDETKSFIVESIHPVFVWKSAPQKRVKLRAQLAPYNFATQVTKLADGKYEFKLSKTHSKKFAEFVRDFRSMIGDSLDDKWDDILAGKSLKLETFEENSLHIELLSSENLCSTQRGNEYSSLIQIDGVTREIIASVPIQDGQGICFDDKGNICVLEGNEIHIYNENLENISSIDVCISYGVGLTFNQDRFYVTVPSKNYVKAIHSKNTDLSEIIRVPSPISVRVHCGSTYILCAHFLAIIQRSMDSNSTPIVLFEKKGSVVSFSDFIIVDNIAFILDSFDGNIYKYEFLTGELKLVNISGYHPSGNPQCICSYEHNQILISETDNNKISSFFSRDSGDHFHFIGEYPFEDFLPNKIATRSRYIFATALNSPL